MGWARHDGGSIYDGLYFTRYGVGTQWSRGNLIDYVTSTYQSAYPGNDMEGSYWYVRR